jgi:hypothetical protein
MNEAVKPRFAVDLDEIERQLAQAHAAPAHAAPSRSDPLAELARIVGQDDPFQSLLGDKSRPHGSEPAGLDDLFVVRDEAGKMGARPQQGYGLRGPVEAEAPAVSRSSYAEPSQSHRNYHDSAATQPHSYDPAYDQDYYQEEKAAGSLVYAPQDEDGHRAAKAGARRGMMAVGALAGAVLLGLGGAYLYGDGSSVLSAGEAPLITANNGPTKIQPQTPGGVEIPNQNKQIYERAAHETQTKVVDREEQPVDVRQATRVQNASAEATGTTLRTPASTGGLNLGEPRRVRTVSIRPDGGVVGSESGRQALAPTAAPQQAPQNAPVPSAVNQSQGAAPQRAAPATPAMATPKATPSPAAPAGGASPQASATPTSQPATQRVASAQPITVPPSAPAPAEVASTGGFAVQLAVSASEGEARSAFQKLQQKYADLGGQPAIIRKAEVNGSTVFRVRVGPMSRDDASSLCSKLQGQGGQCFVAKN